MASSISFCEGTCPTDSKNFLMSLYSRTPPVANLSNATSYSETYETRMLKKEKTNLMIEINHTNDSNKYFKLHTLNSVEGRETMSGGYHLHTCPTRVEILCISIKRKNLTWWENDPLQSISRTAEQTKKSRKIASPQIIKRNSASLRRKHFRSTYCAKVGARAKKALVSTFSTNWRGKRLLHRLE